VLFNGTEGRTGIGVAGTDAARSTDLEGGDDTITGPGGEQQLGGTC
jgi:hypothetical protein